MAKTHKILLVLVLMMIPVFALACGPDLGNGGENDAGEVALCDLSEDLLGWKVATTGTVSFVDLSPRDGIYFELQDQGCEVGGFAHNEFWEGFSVEQKAQVAHGNPIHVRGILTRDGGRLIVSVQEVLP